MKQIEHLLRQSIGLDAASIGSSLIQRTVRLRMKSLGFKQPEDYFQFLENSPSEWNNLIEAVIVAETWFFRDIEPFSALVRLVREEWLPLSDRQTLRMLSVPCSSGEEPYSMAMALLDAGLPADRFRIDAVDISGRALARAQEALYRKNSFRGKDLGFRDRHFKWTKEGFLLNANVRDCVQFWQDNILDESFLKGRAGYDIIFCRNLLIYFDRPTQRKALAHIGQFLNPTGILFVGAAEQPWVIEHGFAPANIPMAFACRKAPFTQAFAPDQRAPFKAEADRSGSTVHNGSPDPVGNGTLPGSTMDPPAEAPLSQLEVARRLADAGQLDEASAICHKHLRESGASAQAYYLLGLLCDAAGDPGALEFYRKALYLEPNHYETLLQMALWSQKNGDAARARTYKNRAQRLKNQKPANS